VYPPALGKVAFDPLRDFAPISLLASGPLIIVAHPSVPVKSVRELIALAKARPGQLNYGSSGTGTSTHVGAELFKWLTQTNIVHIPFKGQGPAIAALIAGEVDLSVSTLPPSLPQVRAGRLRALAVTSQQRFSLAPDLPTVAESGFPDMEASNWYAILAPAKTPSDVISRVHQELARIVRLPDVQQRLASDGVEAIGNTPAQFAAYFKSELTKWTALIQRAKIRAD
jgi:tripartite-type tricarboxylate transporter receptor subunit TctC